MATYGLVKYTQFIDDFVIWMEETPPIISSEIFSDVNQLLQSALVDWNGCFQQKKKKKKKKPTTKTTKLRKWGHKKAQT